MLGADGERFEAIGRLAAGVAHDFNNLLSVVLGLSSELERRLDRPADRNDVAEIRAAAERGVHLTRDLLDFARRPETDPIPVDLNETVDETLMLLRRTLPAGVELRSRPSPGLPRVLLRPGQADRVLVNLVTNARDAIGAEGTILVFTALLPSAPGPPDLPTGWYVALSVRDDGRGMEKEVAARAFEPLFTTKPAGRGTGLGLPGVSRIARGAGGDVRILTRPGSGTTVTVLLPAVRSNGDRLTLAGAR